MLNKNRFLKVLSGFLVLGALVGISSQAHASITPTLSIYSIGDGNTVHMDVSGDPNSNVLFNYVRTGVGSLVASIGTTDSNGNFSSNISSSYYGIATGSQVFVTVNGSSNLQSSSATWPSLNSSGTGNQITLSLRSVTLSVGQTTSITATNFSGTLTIPNNTNPSVASGTIQGNQVLLTGNNLGSTTITVCSASDSSNCSTVNVLVQNGGGSGLNFSQNNLLISTGQSSTVTVSGGNGSYVLTNNSNSSIVQASINGSTINLYANSTIGTSAMTLCSSDMILCGVLTVTVTGGSSSSSITFSQTNPTLSIGQTLSVSVYGGTNASYSVSSNSNNSIVSANISGNTLTLYGISTGSANLTVCSIGVSCQMLPVTVGNSSSSGAVGFSQTNPSILIGQTTSIGMYGNAPFYISSNSNPNTASSSISGNSLLLTGINIGSTNLTVCQNNGQCSNLYVTVSYGGALTTNASFLSFNQQNISLSIGQSNSISVTNGSAAYYLGYNSNSSVVQATMSGNLLSLTGEANGTAVVVVCGSGTICGAVQVTVGTGYFSGSSTLPLGCVSASGFSSITGASCGTTSPSTTRYVFTNFLSIGSTGTEVLELQKKLTLLGVYSGPQNGNFGPLTQAAVVRFQRNKGVSAVGYVGPSTRDALNTS